MLPSVQESCSVYTFSEPTSKQRDSPLLSHHKLQTLASHERADAQPIYPKLHSKQGKSTSADEDGANATVKGKHKHEQELQICQPRSYSHDTRMLLSPERFAMPMGPEHQRFSLAVATA